MDARDAVLEQLRLHGHRSGGRLIRDLAGQVTGHQVRTALTILENEGVVVRDPSSNVLSLREAVTS